MEHCEHCGTKKNLIEILDENGDVDQYICEKCNEPWKVVENSDGNYKTLTKSAN